MKSNNLNKKFNHYLPNVIISVFFCFWIVVTLLIFVLPESSLNGGAYAQIMEDNNVSDIAYDEMVTYFERQTSYTGIAPEVLSAGVNKESVHDAIYSYVDNTFLYLKGETDVLPAVDFDFTALEKSVEENYTQWATDNEVEFDEALKKNMQTTISEAEKVVTTKIDVLMLDYINKPAGISTKVNNYYDKLIILKIAFVFVALIFVGVILLINKKQKRNSIYWLSCGLFSSAMLVTIPMILLRANKYFDGLIIKNDVVYKTLTQSMYRITNDIMIAGIVTFIVSCALMTVFVLLNKNNKLKADKS